MFRRRAPSHLAHTLVLAALLDTCVPVVGGPATVVTAHEPHATPPADAGLAAQPLTPLPVEHVEGLVCPIAFADADVLLARVADATITACDVALVAQRDRRDGLAPRDAHAILQSLISDALLASEARARGLDQDLAVQRRIRDVNASGVIHAETRRALIGELPDQAALRAYYDSHRDDFTSPERVRLREIVVATEAEARAVLHDAASTPFETLLSRTISADGARDQGDLGFVARGGNDRVAGAIADAGFALSEPEAFAPEPVRIERMVPIGHHHRLRREVTWHVVQYLGTTPSRTLDFVEALPVIWHRLAFGREQSARLAARAHLLEQVRTATTVYVDTRALARTRLLRADSHETTPRGARH